MSTNPFKKAVKEKLFGRIALTGPSGGGKTMTALRVGAGMLLPGQEMAVIDTEQRSASKYVGEFGLQFDTLELSNFQPQNYVRAIKCAAEAGYPVLVIDSLSHAWFGVGGLLEQVDAFAKKDQGGNTFAAWKKGTPIQQEFINAILFYPGHVIVTMRSKTEYVVEQNSKGKSAPRKVGTAPVQRDGMEYEFDIFADITIDHEMIISKTRCPRFVDKVILNAGEEFGREYLSWLNSGAERTEPVPAGAEVADAAVPVVSSIPRASEVAAQEGEFTEAPKASEAPPAPAAAPKAAAPATTTATAPAPSTPPPAAPKAPTTPPTPPPPANALYVKEVPSQVMHRDDPSVGKVRYGITLSVGLVGTYSKEAAEAAAAAAANKTMIELAYTVADIGGGKTRNELVWFNGKAVA